MKKFISLVLILSLLMSTTNVALPITAYAENENQDVWAIENSIDSVENETDDTTETEETAGVYSMLQANPEDAYTISLMASFEFSSLTGKVLDASGNGVSGVSVQLYNIDENVCLTACTTGASGTWSSVEYDVIAGYTYQIRYYKAGYEFSNNNIECVATSGGTTLETVTATALDVGNLVCEPNDYEYTINEEQATITKYNGSDAAILLPSELGGYPVTAIGSDAFKKNTTLTTVCLSENIVSVGSYAFQNCTNLKNVYFPNTLTTIGSYAFQNCTALTKLSFPNSLTTINSRAFSGCTGFTSIELPNSVKAIGSYAFENCSNLSSINYPTSWSSADNYIFKGCTNLTSITVPEGVTSIPAYAFYRADNFKTIILPSTLTTIGGYAFYECTGLKNIELPENLTTINSYAFYGCTGFADIKLPNSVKTIGSSAFRSCINLNSISYPTSWTSADSNIFKDCTNLASITIPEGVTTIPAYAFQGANNLKTVNLPNTLTTIGAYAFQNCVEMPDIELPDSLTTLNSYAFSGCEGFTEIELPNSIKTINSSAFRNCVNLSSINYPTGWTTADSSIFNGCTKLTSITIPEGITTIPNYAFQNSNCLKTVNMPSTLTTIGSYAFSGCTQLRYVVVPDGVTQINNYAFSGCTRLRLLYLPNNDITFANNIFNNCDKLTVECEEYSFATIYCINKGIPVQFIGSDFVDNDNLVFDRSNTYYVANTVGALANGYVTMNVAYGYKNNAESQITNQKLSLYIPPDMTLIEKTLKLDGTLLTGYEYEDNILTTSLTNKSGNISFCLKPTGDSTVTTYAIMDFKQNGTAKREVLGIINEDIPLISILANDEVDTADVAVNGVGPADSDIKLYIDGTLAKTVHSNKTGGYNTKVTIPNPSNYASYTITAKATDDEGAEISASKNVVYSSGAPVIQSFTMNYENNTYDVLELGSTKPTVTFNAGSQFGFNVKFSNAEKVEDVYICSTRSNVTKRIKAEWNEATQSYTAKGLFDPSNTSYVPGTITVQYSQVKDKLSFANGIDYSSEKYVNGASDPIKAMLKGKVKDCVEDLVSTDNTLSGVIKMIDVDSQMDFNILTDVIPSWLDPSNAGEYGYEVMEDDYGAQLYLKVAEYGEDKVRGEILDFAKGKVTDFLIEGKYISAVEGIESYFSFVEVLGYADTMLTWDNNRVSINEARQSVLASSMSEAEKAQALQKLEYASKANGGTIACMALGIVLTAAGISLPFPMGLVLPLLSMQNSNYVDDVLGQFGFLDASETDGVMFNFRWKIDPSGYVYDAYTNERLQGVTTTAYWIEYDPNDATFWDNTPADTEYGTLWNASEWDQVNPLITDAEGRYSWDVPEGWWRVKYEKTGYETVWSHWMTVPPVQTDVNIGMTATEKPDKYITYSNSTKTVTVTSNVAYSNASVYIAAYQGGKLLTLKSQPKNIAVGETPVVFSDFDSTGADTVKVMVWENASNLKPLFNTCVVRLK